MINSVLLITNAYPDFDTSYRGIFIKKMATLLQKEGYEIAVVTPKIYKKSQYFENQDGIRVYRFHLFSGNKPLIEYEKVPYLRMILYYFTGFFLTIYVAIKTSCKVIHVHWAIPTGVIGAVVNSLWRKYLIVTIHGSDLRLAMERQGLLRRLFVFVCKRANHLSCVSEIQKKEMEGIGFREKDITVIPMGVDQEFIEARKRRNDKPKNQSFTILSNRNLLPIYNLSLLIQSIPLVLKEEPQTRFLIAGNGLEREKLEKEAKELNVEKSVQFLGSVPHEAMPDLLTKADIYVSTSLYDGTSVSLLEAMAAGAFPVVTDIPSNREWIRDGENGFLVPVNDEQYLANKIIDAIRDKGLLEKARKENQSISEEKTLWPVCIEKFKNIYESQLFKK
jgi:glycosyltransferase involved in cell wall biosynthesis